MAKAHDAKTKTYSISPKNQLIYGMNYWDIVSWVYVLLIVCAFFVGWHKGFWRSLGGFWAGILAFAAAFFLAKPLGDWLYHGLLGSQLETSFKSAIISMSSEAEMSLNAEGIRQLLPAIYNEIHLPSFLQSLFTDFLQPFMPSAGEMVEAALPIAQGAAALTCVAIAFAGVYALVWILYGIVALILKHFRRAGVKPLLISRVFGAVLEIAQVAVFIIVLSFVMNLLSSMQNVVGEWLNTGEYGPRLADDSSMSLSKWLCQQSWLYSWFTSYLHW